MPKSNTKYACTYCGTQDICETLKPWQLKTKRCKHCNHGEFKTLKTYEDTGSNVFGYDEVPELVELMKEWGSYGD